MATIVNNPPGDRERVVETSGTSGWAVAVIILIAVIVIGAVIWMRYYGAPAAATQSTTPGSAQINLTLPSNNGSTDNSGTSNTGTNGGTAANPTPAAAQ